MADKMYLNAAFNHYYKDEVKINRARTQRAVAATIPMVERIMTQINKTDPRFSKNIDKIGSHFQGLKVKRPDEFDFSVPVVGLGTFTWEPYQPRYFQFNKEVRDDMDTYPDDVSVVASNVPLPPPPTGYMSVRVPNIQSNLWNTSDGNMIASGHLIPYMVKHYFRKLLQEAIRTLYAVSNCDTPRLGRKSNGPALTLRIPYKDPEDPSMTEISIDLSPIIPIAVPYITIIGWPRAEVNWPSAEKIEKIKKIGINAKPKRAMDWLRCYARGDKELMEGMDKDGGCRKKCLRILKRIREQHWSVITKPAITSYMLKTVLWWECEELWHTNYWQQEHFSDRVRGLARRLLRYIDNDLLPHYFEPKYNLLGSTDPVKRNNLMLERERILQFLADPIKMLALC